MFADEADPEGKHGRYEETLTEVIEDQQPGAVKVEGEVLERSCFRCKE